MRDLDDLLKEDVQVAQTLDVDALFRGVRSETRRRAHLKELPTRTRMGALGCGCIALGLMLVGLQGLRPDLSRMLLADLAPLCGLLLLQKIHRRYRRKCLRTLHLDCNP